MSNVTQGHEAVLFQQSRAGAAEAVAAGVLPAGELDGALSPGLRPRDGVSPAG